MKHSNSISALPKLVASVLLVACPDRGETHSNADSTTGESGSDSDSTPLSASSSVSVTDTNPTTDTSPDSSGVDTDSSGMGMDTGTGTTTDPDTTHGGTTDGNTGIACIDVEADAGCVDANSETCVCQACVDDGMCSADEDCTCSGCETDEFCELSCDADGLCNPIVESCACVDCFSHVLCGTPPLCGNDVIEPSEDCEGADLDDATCGSLGYEGGVLACADDCSYDVTACEGPTGWLCDLDYYGAGDGCDCGCGVTDPDCIDATLDSCDYCSLPGSCTDLLCDAMPPIDPENNAVCL